MRSTFGIAVLCTALGAIVFTQHSPVVAITGGTLLKPRRLLPPAVAVFGP